MINNHWSLVLALVASLAIIARGHQNTLENRLKRSAGGDEATCPEGELPCGADEEGPNALRCLKSRKFCDAEENCVDGSDEADCETVNPSRAPQGCNTTTNCKLPDCACPMVDAEAASLIPGGLSRDETPQMVMLTLGGGITPELFKVVGALIGPEEYGEEGSSRPRLVNPNGCLVKSTFFVNNEVTDYSLVSFLHNDGHEIGVNGVTGRPDDLEYWQNLGPERLGLELYGMQRLLSQHANISLEDIRGIRAPSMAYHGNNLFEAITLGKENSTSSFVYDSSIFVTPGALPWWPFTLDYSMMDSCIATRGSKNQCPTRSFPGVWEIPANAMEEQSDPDASVSLSMPPRLPCMAVHSCREKVLNDEDLMHDFLMKAFDRHYSLNRAPLNLVLRPATLMTYPAALRGLISFLRDILSSGKDDVYVVRASDVIEWMKRPTKLGKELKAFGPWMKRCVKEGSEIKVTKSNKNNFCSTNICKFPIGNKGSFFRSYCGPCPEKFPKVEDFKSSQLLKEQ